MTDVVLVVPFGANDAPISYGTTDYQPAVYRADITDPKSDLLVKVPAHVADRLCHNSGFYPMPQEETAPNPTGTVRLYAPDGASWNGVFYTPDVDDIVVVPAAAAADLLSFPPICPEASRPEPEPRAWDPEEDRRHVEELGLRIRSEVISRDARIAELEEQLRVAQQEPPVLVEHAPAPPRPVPSSTPSGRSSKS